MEKVYAKDRFSNTPKQKSQPRSSSSRYMKPGALAQLRYTKTSTAKFYTDLGKKRVVVYSAKKAQDDVSLIENKAVDKSPLMLSPVDLLKQNYLVKTPKTPRIEDGNSESKLESLPMDLLVLIARQFRFDYTTPNRSRQEMLSTMTPRLAEHWPFIRKANGRGAFMSSPHIPKAPRHGPRPLLALKSPR